MDSHLKQTLKIAIPSIVEGMMQTFVAIINTSMVGGLGSVSTAAVGLGAIPSWFINGCAVLTAIPGTFFIAKSIGAQDKDEGVKSATHVLSMGIIFGIVLFLLMFTISNYYPVWMGVEPEVIPEAISYIKIYSFAIPMAVTGITASGAIKGCGNTKTPMYVSMLANGVLVVSNLFLIHKSFTLPLGFLHSLMGIFPEAIIIKGLGLGVVGAGMSIIIAHFVSCSILVSLLVFRTQRVHVDIKKMFKLEKARVKAILDVGRPAMGEKVVVNIGQIGFQRIITTLGTASVAAHHLANTTESLCYMPAYGVAIASTALVGQAIGSKNEDEARRYAKQNIILAFAIGIFGGSIFFFLPGPILSFFTDDPDVMSNGIAALRIISIIEPLFSISIVLTGILQGGGETKPPFISSMIGMLVIRLIFASIFIFWLKLPLWGAWLAMGIDIAFRAGYNFYFYKKGGWLRRIHE